ncbi:MAG: dihydroorotase [Oscillospiraceae bacterium]|nr:dihydroorotase [Oscillospiraceae bacterium]
MKLLLKNATVYTNGAFSRKDILTDGEVFARIDDCIECGEAFVFDFSDKFIFPGFVDVHVHLREPGFSLKETIKTGTMSAAKGGYTTVFAMPNLNPTPDSAENLAPQLEAIKRDAVINVIPYGTITVGEKGEQLSDMEAIAHDICAFSDDGKGVQSEETMLEAMRRAKALNKIIAAHCEDNSLLEGGYIHKGKYALEHGHKGICSESEWRPIARDIELCKQTGVSYHVCHVSAKESVEIIRKAKREGVDITCETGPHYLILDDSCLKEEGRFKMNPPLRDKTDRLALIEGIKDGTIDMIATDHAPHTKEEKSKGLAGSLMGVVGLETAFAELYTNLVKTNVISLEKLVELMSLTPARRFGVESGIEVGKKASLTVFDLSKSYTVDPEDFLTKGRSTPFEGDTVFGECLMTVTEGKISWKTSL